MTMLVLLMLAVPGLVVVLAVGRAIGGRRFERQLRLITVSHRDRLLSVEPIALEAHRWSA